MTEIGWLSAVSKWLRLRLWIALLLFALPLGSQATELNRAVEEFVDLEWPSTGAPGLAYAIVDGSKVRSGSRGNLVAGGQDEVTPDTPFLIGSISKSFTALAIMQLVESGDIDLDERIGSYLDRFSERASGAITVRQLLSHTSGYSTVQGNSRHSAENTADEQLADHVAGLSQWETAHAPGAVWEYSNANYHILGALIEEVSGIDYATFVETRILEPLDMVNSSVSDEGVLAEVATGHTPWFGSNRPYLETSIDRVGAPAGGIFASANDLANYLAMMMNGEDDLITAASKAEMLSPAGGAASFYGLGWFIDSETGTASHGGLVPGTETLATIAPASRKGVIVLVNANGGIGFSENLELRNGITAIALGLDYTGEGSRLWPKLTYLMMMSLPVFFVASIAWAWLRRTQLSTKSGAFGLFSLWFPVPAMIAMAVSLILIIPQIFGGSIATLLLFQPDFGWMMVAAAITGPLWAIFRLLIAYRGRTSTEQREVGG